MVMGGGFCMNVNMPGTVVTLGRSVFDDLVHREGPLGARLHVGEDDALVHAAAGPGTNTPTS